MRKFGINYEYKQTEKKNGDRLISVRDIGENALLEVEKIHKDIMQNNNA
ncbi:hypothetical protein [Niallia circulans]|nr:hypothetical protein [Niallia circulans]